MKVHILQSPDDEFEAIREGHKTAELRDASRGFEPGDTLLFLRYCPETGEQTLNCSWLRVARVESGRRVPTGLVLLSCVPLLWSEKGDAMEWLKSRGQWPINPAEVTP